MNKATRRLLEQISEPAIQSMFGSAILQSKKEYEGLPNGLATFAKCLHDFSEKNDQLKAVPGGVAEANSFLIQVFIATYAKAKSHSTTIANALLLSMTEDYPGKEGTCLLPKLYNLSNAATAFRSTCQKEDALLIWEQSKSVFLNYNEFLNAFLPFLSVAWEAGQRKKPNTKIFNMSFAKRLEHFEALTNADNGIFYILLRLSNKDLRNAIAHSDVWRDCENDMVCYPRKENDEQVTEQLPMLEYLARIGIASYLPQVYLAFVSAVALLEEVPDVMKNALPVLHNIFISNVE